MSTYRTHYILTPKIVDIKYQLIETIIKRRPIND